MTETIILTEIEFMLIWEIFNKTTNQIFHCTKREKAELNGKLNLQIRKGKGIAVGFACHTYEHMQHYTLFISWFCLIWKMTLEIRNKMEKNWKLFERTICWMLSIPVAVSLVLKMEESRSWSCSILLGISPNPGMSLAYNIDWKPAHCVDILK